MRRAKRGTKTRRLCVTNVALNDVERVAMALAWRAIDNDERVVFRVAARELCTALDVVLR